MRGESPISGMDLEALREQIAPIERLAREKEQPLALVGGVVRDLLLGLAFRDLDLVVEGDAIMLVEELVVRFGGRAGVHRSFGTASWIALDGSSVEIASARREHYSRPGALPDVAPASLEEDLARRDFSINAMALSLSAEEPRLVDPFGGREALAKRELRVLHGHSFDDDPTRVLRALRFCSRLDFTPPLLNVS